MKPKQPKWIKPTRQAKLIELWIKYGNKCLLGHTACADPAHYRYTDYKTVNVAIPKEVPCQNSQGMPLKDSQANPLFITVYQVQQSTIAKTDTDMRLYDLKERQAIADWIADDRAQAQAEWQAEYEARHRTNDRRYPVHGRFSGVSQDVYYDQQPEFYIEGLGVSGLTFKAFAKVRLSSNFMRLHVYLGDTFKGLSKSKKRKAVRYGKIPATVQDDINQACWSAVKQYLNR
jgi:hypothetical protein